MKTKVLLLLAVSTLVTLSFTFVKVKHNTETVNKSIPSSTVQPTEPLGGLASEGKL